MQKPDVDSIEGLSPAISIEQKTTSKNPRSTVGTVTDVGITPAKTLKPCRANVGIDGIMSGSLRVYSDQKSSPGYFINYISCPVESHQ